LLASWCLCIFFVDSALSLAFLFADSIVLNLCFVARGGPCMDVESDSILPRCALPHFSDPWEIQTAAVTISLLTVVHDLGMG